MPKPFAVINANTETWYAIEVSKRGADKWFAESSNIFNSFELATESLVSQCLDRDLVYEYRIVQTVQITGVAVEL
jgi:hypothetical protein